MTATAQQIIVNAWRDEEFFEGLSEAQKTLVPKNPAGATYVRFARADSAPVAYSTFITNTCDTFITGCCSTFITNTCDTFITGCCGLD